MIKAKEFFFDVKVDVMDPTIDCEDPIQVRTDRDGLGGIEIVHESAKVSIFLTEATAKGVAQAIMAILNKEIWDNS